MVSIKTKVHDVETEDNSKQLSMMSKLVNILIKIRFIPVKNDAKNLKITFKLCSMVTFTFFVVHFGASFLSYAIYEQIVSSIRDIVTERMMKYNAIDIASIYAFIFLLYWFPFCPLFLGHALPSVPTIFRAKDLKWPKHGAKHLAALFLFALGQSAIYAGFWSEALKEKNVPEQTAVLLYILPIALSFGFTSYWVVPALLVSALMDKFIFLCECRAVGKELAHAKRCLELYSAFDCGFGLFFFFVFGVSQVFVIFTLYLTISGPIESSSSVFGIIIYSSGQLLASCGLMLNIAGLTFSLDAGHKSLKGLANVLQDQLVHVTEGSERQTIKNTIKVIEQTGPLNGKGFFDITRGTLTGMVSVGFTYIIILVQFKMSIT